MYTLDNLDVYKQAQTFGDKIWFIAGDRYWKQRTGCSGANKEA